MCVELRIKSKHLACEPGIIRIEEEKLKKQIKWLRSRGEDTERLEQQLQSLISHRRWDVANESRATFLARAFIKGKPYSSVERGVKDQHTLKAVILPRVIAMVKKYQSPSTTAASIIEWLQT